MENEFEDLFKRAITCLKKNEISFVVVGGAIVPYYGNLRSTQDIDLMLLMDTESSTINSLIQCFNRNNISITTEEITESFAENIHVTGFDEKTWIYRLDIKRISSLFDKFTFENRRIVKFHELEIPISSLESLISIKISDGFRSDQDLEDISSIIDTIDVGDIDLDILRHGLQLVNATDKFISFLTTLNTENSKRLLNLLDFQDDAKFE